MHHYCEIKISPWRYEKVILYGTVHIRIQMGALTCGFMYTRLLGDTSLIIVTILTLDKKL